MRQLNRRGLLRAGAATGIGGVLGARVVPLGLGAQEVLVTAHGSGVNLKRMPDDQGNPTVPMRESFGFDPLYAQCLVEDTAERFAMDTFGMGRVVIEPHQFFMAMYADVIGLESARRAPDGSLTAVLRGSLACSTFVGTASVAIGSREAEEHALFRIEATDGGIGVGAPPDRFAFTVYFDPEEASINHDIFGPEFTFTGEMIAGKITIGPPLAVPLLLAAATPQARTPGT